MKLTAENIKTYLANTPQITFEITECCNLSCLYCGYGKLYNNKGKRHNRMMPIENAIAFLDYIKKLWDVGYDNRGEGTLVISFYGGEPLLNMSFIKAVISYIEENLQGYRKHFAYTMTTNATLLPKYMDYLVSKSVHLLISLDGDEKGSSCRVYHNGKQAFPAITKAIDELREKYPRFFEENVQFNSVLTQKTSVKAITEYIWQTYGKKPSVSEVNPDGVNLQYEKDFKQIYLEKWKSVQEFEQGLDLGKIKFEDHPRFEQIARYVQKHSPYVYQDYNDLLFADRTKEKEFPTGTCLPFTKKVFVNVTGRIMPCEMISYRYGYPAIKQGKVDVDFQLIADSYNSYFERVAKVCRCCRDSRGCLCCMFNNGMMDSPKGKCKYFMDSKTEKMVKSEVYSFLLQYPESYSYIMSSFEVV